MVKQSFADFEVVVVWKKSQDGTPKVVEQYANKLQLKFVLQTSPGLVGAMNDGIASSIGTVVVRTDDDVIASKSWLEGVVELIDKKGVGGVTGPTIIPENRLSDRDVFKYQAKFYRGNIFWKIIGKIYLYCIMDGQPLAVSKWLRSGAFTFGSNYASCLNINEPFEVTHHEACNMAFRREIFERIGGFDPLFDGFSEFNEADLSFKIRNLGYKIFFNPKARVDHLVSQDGAIIESQWAESRMRNFINFYFRHIKPNTLGKILRFGLHVILMNGYYLYTAGIRRERGRLGCIQGSITAIIKNLGTVSRNEVNK